MAFLTVPAAAQTAEPVVTPADPDAPRVGLQAAESLGVSPDRVLKTLMTLVDGKPVCAILASDQDRDRTVKLPQMLFRGKMFREQPSHGQ